MNSAQSELVYLIKKLSHLLSNTPLFNMYNNIKRILGFDFKPDYDNSIQI